MDVLAGSQTHNPDVITIKFPAICFHNCVVSLLRPPCLQDFKDTVAGMVL